MTKPVQHPSEIPEERNPRGHDAQPGPRSLDLSTPASADAALADVEATPSANAAFIAKEFDVPERKAAELVSGKEASEEEVANLTAKVRAKVAESPLPKGAPQPEGDPNELTADTDETALKPVLNAPNKRAGGG